MMTCNDSHDDCSEGNDKNTGAGGRLMADETANTGTAANTQSVKYAL